MQKGLVITGENLDKSYCQIQGWKYFVYICVMHQTSVWEARNIVHKDRFVAIIL